MHLHLLGIGGTFMSALAILAKQAGHQVTGCDANCYPPVSTLLEQQGIAWQEGYEDSSLALKADCVIVGNAMKRGMPVLEAVLNHSKHYTSGPQWLAENILPHYRVLAVAGTHGKTTTTSMIAFILHKAGFDPAFLIGGVAPDFASSARLGKGEWFVIEADEYDSALFDKRPKLMHYRPEIALLNNLEFDHADIYADLEAIKQQFHYYMKTIPARGLVLKPRDDQALNDVLNRGVYSRVEELALEGEATWRAEILDASGQSFRVFHHNAYVAEVNWPLIGRFNVENGLAAIAASVAAGVDVKTAAQALAQFTPVKRRLEVRGVNRGVTVYDDFAHHPTAIGKTLAALKQSGRHKRIFTVLEFASHTMRSGVHAAAMGEALQLSDQAFILCSQQFDLHELARKWSIPYHLLPDSKTIVEKITNMVQADDAIVVMSNRSFDNIHQQLLEGLGNENCSPAACSRDRMIN